MTASGTLLRLAADHLWQSTLVAGVVAILARTFRHHGAHVRFRLWLVASIKFLLPFSALIAAGARVGWTHAPLPAPVVRTTVDGLAQPFTLALPSGEPFAGAITETIASSAATAESLGAFAVDVVLGVWLTGTLACVVRWAVAYRRLLHLASTAPPIDDTRTHALLRQVTTGTQSISVVAAPASMEPGIVGLVRPVLLWPAGIADRMEAPQIESILRHELAHVRRRDNLTSAIHMLVEALFWFHPLVWWIGARLVDERERACDEAVLRDGSEPGSYAEGILRTCRHYVESPLPCVSGVTGSNLKRRIEAIMRHVPSRSVTRAHRLLLTACGTAALALPLVIGLLQTPRLLAQAVPDGPRFDVVSIKVNRSGVQGGTNQNQPGRYVATNISLRMLIANAYGLLDSQIAGGPEIATAGYAQAQKFDINATFSGTATPPQRQAMMRAMLADRFKLVAHTETREMPVYVLTTLRADGSFGPSMKETTDPECLAAAAARTGGAGASSPASAPSQTPPAGSPPAPGSGGARGGGPLRCGTLQFGPGSFTARSAPLEMLVNSLSNRTPITGIDRIILDRTGLTSRYDFELRWRLPAGMGRGLPPGAALPPGVTPPTPDPDLPDLFTAVQEQLGLKLESTRAPIEVLVIDSASEPVEN